MNHLDAELKELKDAILEMMALCITQLEKTKDAFLNYDEGLAQDVIHNEKRMNALELSIDRNCENIFALFQPVATDLRFVISMLKTNSDLERIGDYADGIADYVINIAKPIPKEALDATHMADMFDIAISMMIDIQRAYEEGNSKLARDVYRKDAQLNKINSTASNTISKLIEDKPSEVRAYLFLFSTIRKIERTGDHIKNVAEDIIFHLEAEVIKHKKKK
ncbi:MAG: phosphate signaling complex protein PhoU [Flavobacteriales bacterium]|nr:phosphate signaling complex protein PhoU [Flavobacteriales bacterium]